MLPLIAQHMLSKQARHAHKLGSLLQAVAVLHWRWIQACAGSNDSFKRYQSRADSTRVRKHQQLPQQQEVLTRVAYELQALPKQRHSKTQFLTSRFT